MRIGHASDVNQNQVSCLSLKSQHLKLATWELWYPVNILLQWEQRIVSSMSVSMATSRSADGSLKGFILQQHSDMKLYCLRHTCVVLNGTSKNAFVASHCSGTKQQQPFLPFEIVFNRKTRLHDTHYITVKTKHQRKDSFNLFPILHIFE